MNLELWLEQNEKTKMGFCMELGINPTYLYRAGTNFNMNVKIAKKICQYTNGEVTLQDLRPDLFI